MTGQETKKVVRGSFSKQFDCGYRHLIEESSKNGLSWQIHFSLELASFDSFKKINLCPYVMCRFEWDEAELKRQGFDGFEGQVVVVHRSPNKQDVRHPYEMELIHSGQWIRRRMGTDDLAKLDAGRCHVKMEVLLEKFSFKAKEVVSKRNDAVLVVEGNKISVNKNYLSMHSEFFDTLFNSNFKEKTMLEIPISNVKYVDFAHLLAVIHPLRSVLPTDETIETLLDLADRFMLPVVTERALNHLRYSSDLPFEDFLSITDKYNMQELWELNVKLIESKTRMKLLIENIKYEELSETARLKLFSHFATIIKRYDFAN